MSRWLQALIVTLAMLVSGAPAWAAAVIEHVTCASIVVDECCAASTATESARASAGPSGDACADGCTDGCADCAACSSCTRGAWMPAPATILGSALTVEATRAPHGPLTHYAAPPTTGIFHPPR